MTDPCILGSFRGPGGGVDPIILGTILNPEQEANIHE